MSICLMKLSSENIFKSTSIAYVNPLTSRKQVGRRKREAGVGERREKGVEERQGVGKQ